MSEFSCNVSFFPCIQESIDKLEKDRDKKKDIIQDKTVSSLALVRKDVCVVLKEFIRVVRVRSLARVIVLCSWARHFTLTVPRSTQGYKWVPVNCQGNQTKCWGVTSDGLASHPGGVAILLVASCYENQS